ncbi:MAG: RelA/SpoT family protein [Oscillospiraceae bacterium]|jgi:GTP pyrophosphokinase|nr:RelA/SpoT family protein [Oscillospiraceae bacterium]
MIDQSMAARRFEELLERCRALRWRDGGQPVLDNDALERLRAAYAFASQAHGDQRRASGEPYIMHPIAVAQLLLDLELYDMDCLVAALLHDVVEDTPYKNADITQRFGEVIMHLVDGLTKLQDMRFSSKEAAQAENTLKMLIATLNDPRVILIKLADRLHNMRTLEFKNEESQRRIAAETMHIYAPIADILGVRLFKEEMEDLAIRFLDPPGYKEIEDELEMEKEARTAFLESIQQKLRMFLSPHFPPAGEGGRSGFHVEGRVKSVHGIHRKLFHQHKSFGEIFDVYAVRVIVDSVEECWRAFGLIQQVYHMIQGRFKNYINNPKKNGYQSIHMTMVGEEKIPFEVQIRTWGMHETAERGIAIHWKHTRQVENEITGLENLMVQFQELIDNSRDADTLDEVVQSIRSDIAPLEKVYPTTPKGETKELKQGATVLDFAYAVHTKIGHRMVGAKVNSRIVPIDYQVQSGDIVEVLLSPNEDKGPSRDWIHFVATNQAKSKIRAWFKKERREENIGAGRHEIESELRRNFTRLAPKEWEDVLLRVLDRKHFEVEEKNKTSAERLEDFYAAVGYGGMPLQSCLPQLREEYQKLLHAQQDEMKFSKISSDKGVIVEGIDRCQVKFAQCCHPLPGDTVVGYITRTALRDGEVQTGGLTVHKRNCTNVPADLAKAPEPDRWLPARWGDTAKTEYRGVLTIHTVNQTGMTAKVSTLLGNLHISIEDFHAHNNHDGTGTVIAVVGVSSREQLENVRGKVCQVKGVTEVVL